MSGVKNEASCMCGQLKLGYSGEITRTSVCHCFDCQKRTGSAFGVQTRLESDKVTIMGDSTKFVKTGDSGGLVDFHFCPHCGTTLYWYISEMPGYTCAAIGPFCNPHLPSPAMMVYGNRKHDWVVMPESTVEYFDD